MFFVHFISIFLFLTEKDLDEKMVNSCLLLWIKILLAGETVALQQLISLVYSLSYEDYQTNVVDIATPSW